MARHAGEAPTLINALVGMAICGIMNNELMQFIQQPGAPNMYWPLTDLPQPLIDPRKGYHGERLSVMGLFPGLREMAANP